MNDDLTSMKDKQDGTLTVSDRIHRCFDKLTPTERKCARLLLSNYPLEGLAPLAEYAQRAGTSHPSVLRFIAKLGFSGYATFQATLRHELGARLKSPLNKRKEEPDPNTLTNKDFLHHFARTSCDNIQQTIASLSEDSLEGALSLLADKSSDLFLLGGRFSGAIAAYAYMRLRILRDHVHHIVGMSVSWAEYLLDIHDDCVLVVFDVRRYQGDLAYFAQAASERGARILLITDQWLSPIAGIADYILPAHIEVPSRWDSMAPVMTLTESLIAILTNRRWQELEGRIHDLEQLRGRYEQTWPSKSNG